MAGTTWPSLLAGRKAKASEVEEKFDWIEGDIVPMSGGNLANNAYNLGTSTAQWKSLYIYGVANAVGTLVLQGLEQINFEVSSTVGMVFYSNKSLYVGDGAGSSVPSAVLAVHSANSLSTLNLLLMNRIPSSSNETKMTMRGTQGGATDVSMDMRFSAHNNKLIYDLGIYSNVFTLHGSSVSIGTSTADSNTLLDISGTRALRIPRVSTTQRDALTAADGMMVYNSITSQFQFREGNSWNAYTVAGPYLRVRNFSAFPITATFAQITNWTSPSIDTASAFTNSTWTPGQVGIYFFSIVGALNHTTDSSIRLVIRKNNTSTVEEISTLGDIFTVSPPTTLTSFSFQGIIRADTITDDFRVFGQAATSFAHAAQLYLSAYRISN